MYQRNSNEAFENAKLKGLNNPSEVMYMYSLENSISICFLPPSFILEYNLK